MVLVHDDHHLEMLGHGLSVEGNVTVPLQVVSVLQRRCQGVTEDRWLPLIDTKTKATISFSFVEEVAYLAVQDLVKGSLPEFIPDGISMHLLYRVLMQLVSGID